MSARGKGLILVMLFSAALWVGIAIVFARLAPIVEGGITDLLPAAYAQDDDGYARPDQVLTPGAVSSDGIEEICRPGYSRAHRLPYGTDLEHARFVAVFKEYGVPTSDSRQYVLDDRVPIEIGGENISANLWPQPIVQARAKDQLENEARVEVCAGKMSLQDAQQWFLGDWVDAYRRVFNASPAQ